MTRVALLAGVIAVAAGLYFALHESSTSEAKPTSERTTSPAVATSATTAPSLGNGATPVVATEHVERANVAGLPEPLEPGYLAVEHAAKGCYRGRPAPQPIRPNGPDETIEAIQLSYRQVVSHGVGHIEGLEVSHGQLTDQALQSCIVKVVASATWKSNAPDGEIGDLQQNITLGDLMRPDYGLPPPEKRSPKPTAPPPAELAGPLGKPAVEAEDDHAGVMVSAPRP
jgi:hypothetical protein